MNNHFLASNAVSIAQSFTAPFPFRILLVEDNLLFQKLTLMNLQRMGYAADAVGNGYEALEVLRYQTYGVIFMDIEMPEMDGIVATRHIRQLSSSDSHPWIIALTANQVVGSYEACLQAGMNDYLIKPAQPADLAKALERYRSASVSQALF